MFKIGEFSRLSQVTVKTLRFYDQEGLLQPARVDPATGYRYYSADQLPRLNRILALKALGFSLEQIRQMIAEDISADELRGMFRLRRAEIEQQMAAEQQRLEQLMLRLKQIEREGDLPAYEVVLKPVESLTVASLRATIPTYSHTGQLVGDLFGSLMPRGIQPTGPLMAIFHDGEYRESDCDVEVVVPIVGGEGDGRVQVRALPGADMVTTIYQGEYDSIGTAYTAVMRWIEQNGYPIAGPSREVYLHGPAEGIAPDAYVTEVQFPVQRV
ncbi:MAG: MerR family transcriptional regulator [Anaerolineae bacterium]|nr:MerR family transcriptional regulator [Anaerolineae bacterium]